MRHSLTSGKADGWTVALGFSSFVVLGMPGALLNVAWSPSIRATFSLRLEAVGLLYLASTTGYFIAGSASGRLIDHWGAARLLISSAVLGALGLLGFALAPAWRFVLLSSLVAGAGAGLLDGGMNIYFAAHFSPRLMNWLHASFGVGATLGPLTMTAILEHHLSWRWGYGLGALLYAGVAMLFLLTGPRWKLAGHAAAEAGARVAATRETLRLAVVWLGIGLFLAYTGLEVSAGQWSFPLFTDSRHVPWEVAGQWVSLYWGSFTLGRIFFGAVVPWIRPAVLVRACLAGAALSAGLLGWKSLGASGFLPLALFGFSLSPIFALMITRTQEQLGPVHAPNAIGLQVAAAAAGVGILPGLAGVLAKQRGLEIIPGFLLAVTLLMMGLFEAMQRPEVG